MNKARFAGLVFVLVVSLAACRDGGEKASGPDFNISPNDTLSRGAEAGWCKENGECDAGLVCNKNRACVKAPGCGSHDACTALLNNTYAMCSEDKKCVVFALSCAVDTDCPKDGVCVDTAEGMAKHCGYEAEPMNQPLTDGGDTEGTEGGAGAGTQEGTGGGTGGTGVAAGTGAQEGTAGGTAGTGMQGEAGAAATGGGDPGGTGGGTETEMQGAGAAMGPKALGVKFTQVAVGRENTCAISRTSELYCWGGAYNGEKGSLWPKKVSQPMLWKSAIFGTKPCVMCGINKNDELYCWENCYGDDELFPQSPKKISDEKVVDVSPAAYDEICGIKKDGKVCCWPYPWKNEGKKAACTTSAGWKDVEARGYVCGIGNDGSLWRLEYLGHPFDGVYSEQLAAGKKWLHVNFCYAANASAMDLDGKLFDILEGHLTLESNLSFEVVDYGHGHRCGIGMDKKLYCWGNNHYGQSAPNNMQNGYINSSTLVNTDSWVSVSVGETANHTCAIKVGGTLWCWGDNTYGQIGNGQKGQHRVGITQVKVP